MAAIPVEQHFVNNPQVMRAVLPLAQDRLKALFSKYLCKVYFETGEWGLFGLGGFTNANAIHAFGDTDKTKPALIIGNHCQMASKCSILLGGEHHNHQALNQTISDFPDIKELLKRKGIQHNACYSRGQVRIGSNVVISLGVTILSGVTIGNGAVIGAGSLVNKDVPPFAIVAGNPAKVLKYRFDPETIAALERIRWWDFSLSHFFEYFEDIQTLHLPQTQQKMLRVINDSFYIDNQNYLIFQMEPGAKSSNERSFLGVEMGGKFLPVSKLPDTFKFYVSQMMAPPQAPIHIVKDIFTFSGMVATISAEHCC